MATHSSILAWKIPLTEEPGGLHPMGLQTIRHDWVTEQQQLPRLTLVSPKKAMAPHSSTLAWKIPWTEEPGRLPSMGSHSWTRLKWLSSSNPGGSVVKNLSANVGDLGSIPGLGRCPGEGNSNPHHFCLGNPMDRGAFQGAVCGVAKRASCSLVTKHQHRLPNNNSDTLEDIICGGCYG